MATVEDALALHSLGWRVVPAPIAGKSPIGSWKRAQTERATEREVRESFAVPRNIFIITGAISQLAVLDCDDRQAEIYWRERLGPVMDRTTCATTGKGRHYYFKLAPGETLRGRSSPGGESGKWDLRGDGGGVIAPPSTHPSGKTYRWPHKRGPEALEDLPPGIRASEPSSIEKGPKTKISELLSEEPQEGNRNVWLSKVAGHYAAKFANFDEYEVHVRRAADPLGLEEEEVEKLIRSIWTSEQAKEGRAIPEPAPEGEGGDWRVMEPDEESGYLVSGDTRILVQVRERDEENEGKWRKALAPWLRADLRTIGVFEMPDDSRVYHVEVRTEDGHREVDVSSKIIGNTTKLNEWLAGLGLGLLSPENPTPHGMSHSSRLVHYLEAQGAPSQQAAGSLGWHTEADGFLTHEGVLRATGFHPFEAVRPAPHVRDWAPYVYGMQGADGEAAEILREVLSFHFPQVAAVFGSWWAACLLKPQISDVFSQFPLMAIEAPSESGKSTGFFPMMLELAGNTQGKSVPTKAALRDYLSAHKNGIVWVDDVDDLQAYGELMRGTTTEGAVVKKGLNQFSQMSVQLHAALSISGESLGLRRQKALLDRCVDLRVPSPIARKSTRGDYPQWDDIVTVKRDHPDLTDYAGTFVVSALGSIPALEKRAVRARRGNLRGGRMMDKLTIVRLGAWLLERIAGIEDNWVREEVEAWATGRLETYDPTDNTLTTEVLPQALYRTGMKQRPEGPDATRKQLPTPVFVTESGVVWFSPKLLAAWWSDLHYGRIEQRVASEEALTQQAKALGAGGKKGTGRKYYDYITGGGGCNYWRLPDGVGDKVIEIAQGKE